ncbi:MAG: flagellin [Lachnospiraceae bacterium]|nr:flagellin [Lachnospiraceae bacterium]
MRVTHAATYRKFTSSVNSVHSKLNKSMNKISSGREYENAAENPLAYYEGKKMDNQYQDIETKLELISDVKNRLYQQEAGATSIQNTLSAARVKVEYIRNGTNNDTSQESATLEIVKNDLIQKMQSMVNDLNAQYQDYFIYGGNDLSTSPFSLSGDGMTLTYNHTFPGDPKATSISMTMDENGTYSYVASGYRAETNQNVDPKELLQEAMCEQGRIDVGYGTIRNTETLLDTYTGGLNLLTGISSDEMNAAAATGTIPDIGKALTDSPLGILGQTVRAIEKYQDDENLSKFTESMGTMMTKITEAEQYVSTVYSDLGNKYALLESAETRLNALSDGLEEQYSEKLGADPYEAITEMYSHRYSYQASLQLGSSLMRTSLFDFMS